MPGEYEFVIVAIISTVGMMITVQLWQLNWFKRENFKIKKKNIEGENRLKLKKLEKELGLQPSKEPREERSKFDTLSDLLPVLSKLDADQLGVLIDKFAGGGEYDLPETEGGLLDMLGDFADKNPEAVKSFIEGLSGKKTSKQETTPEFPTQ